MNDRKNQHTFRVLAVFRASLIDVEAMSCLCINAVVDTGVVESLNSYCCLDEKVELLLLIEL